MSTGDLSTVVSSDARRYTIVDLKQVNELPLRNALQTFDKNGDGKIDISELQKIVYWYGLWKYASIGLCLIVMTLVWATFGLTIWAIDLTKDYTVTDGVLTGGDEVVKMSVASTYIPLSWATLLDRRHLDSLESLSIDVTRSSGKFSAGLYHMKVASYLHANSSYLKLFGEDGSRVWVNSGTVVLHHPDAEEAIMVCGAAACNTLAVDVKPEYLQQLIQRSVAILQNNRDFELPSSVDGVAINKAAGKDATCMASVEAFATVNILGSSISQQKTFPTNPAFKLSPTITWSATDPGFAGEFWKTEPAAFGNQQGRDMFNGVKGTKVNPTSFGKKADGKKKFAFQAAPEKKNTKRDRVINNFTKRNVVPQPAPIYNPQLMSSKLLRGGVGIAEQLSKFDTVDRGFDIGELKDPFNVVSEMPAKDDPVSMAFGDRRRLEGAVKTIAEVSFNLNGNDIYTKFGDDANGSLMVDTELADPAHSEQAWENNFRGRRRLGENGENDADLDGALGDLARTAITGAADNAIRFYDEAQKAAYDAKMAEKAYAFAKDIKMDGVSNHRRRLQVDYDEFSGAVEDIDDGFDTSLHANAGQADLDADNAVEIAAAIQEELEDDFEEFARRRLMWNDAKDFQKMINVLQVNPDAKAKQAVDVANVLNNLADENDYAFAKEIMMDGVSNHRRLQGVDVDFLTLDNMGYVAAAGEVAENAVEAVAAEAQAYEKMFDDLTTQRRRLQLPEFDVMNINYRGGRLSDDAADNLAEVPKAAEPALIATAEKFRRRRLQDSSDVVDMVASTDLNLSDFGSQDSDDSDAATTEGETDDPDHEDTWEFGRRRLEFDYLKDVDLNPRNFGGRVDDDASKAAYKGAGEKKPEFLNSSEKLTRRRLELFNNIVDVDVNPRNFGGRTDGDAVKAAYEGAGEKKPKFLNTSEKLTRRLMQDLDGIVNPLKEVPLGLHKDFVQAKNAAASTIKDAENANAAVAQFEKGFNGRLQVEEPVVQSERRRLMSGFLNLNNRGYNIIKKAQNAALYTPKKEANAGPALESDSPSKSYTPRRRFQDVPPVQTERRRLPAQPRIMGIVDMGYNIENAEDASRFVRDVVDNAKHEQQSNDSSFRVVGDGSTRRRLKDEPTVQTIGGVSISSIRDNGFQIKKDFDQFSKFASETDGVSDLIGGMLGKVSKEMTPKRRRLDANVVAGANILNANFAGYTKNIQKQLENGGKIVSDGMGAAPLAVEGVIENLLA